MAKAQLPSAEEFPSNSEISRTHKPKTEAVAHGKIRQPSLAKKTMTAMFAADTKDVFGYILWDVAIPAIKQTISDVVTSGIERALFGDTAPRRRSSSFGSRLSYTNYSSASRRPELDSPTTPARTLSRRARTSFDFGEILLDDRQEGVVVIERLRDILDRYDLATVADLYDLVGISSKYTDNDWGWTNLEELRDAGVRRVNGGYILEIPEPKPVK